MFARNKKYFDLPMLCVQRATAGRPYADDSSMSSKNVEHLNMPQLYELFKDTLNHCGTFLLTCTREDIEYHIFEEFDSDCTSFLHESNLRALLEGGLISAEIYEASLRLAAKFRALEGTPLWNPDDVTHAAAWRNIMESADRIKTMLERI